MEITRRRGAENDHELALGEVFTADVGATGTTVLQNEPDRSAGWVAGLTFATERPKMSGTPGSWEDPGPGLSRVPGKPGSRL